MSDAARYQAGQAVARYASRPGLGESLEHEAELRTRLSQTEDHRSATAAFVARQRPAYLGR